MQTWFWGHEKIKLLAAKPMHSCMSLKACLSLGMADSKGKMQSWWLAHFIRTMFGCTFGFKSDKSIDLYTCVLHTCRSSCLCGHEQAICFQIHACMSLRPCLSTDMSYKGGTCSIGEDVSHLICGMLGCTLGFYSSRSMDPYMCSLRTWRSSGSMVFKHA